MISEGKAPLQLDSQLPTLDIRDYLLKETRYKVIKNTNPEKFEEIVRQRTFENNYKSRFLEYLSKFKAED